MKDFLRRLLLQIVWSGLKLRYKITVKNPEVLDQLIKSNLSTIFLPNHPAEVDPIILYSYLSKKFTPRPLVVEKFFYLMGAQFFMQLVRAIPIPDFDVSVTEWKKKRGEKSYQAILQAVKDHNDLLIYPAGQLKRTPKETIGGSSMVHRLVHEMPKANVVLVRISGLWGSSFSRGLTGDVDDFWNLIVRGAKVLLKNFIFFIPKREVTLEFQVNPADFPYHASKIAFNRYLEKFYNQYLDEKHQIHEQEPLKLVSYSAFSHDVPEINYKSRHQSKFEEEVNIDEASKEKILQYLKHLINDPQKQIHEEDHLSHQLGLDSLDVANAYTFVCKTFDVHFKVEPGDVRTVHDLYYIATQKDGNSKVAMDKSAPEWEMEGKRPEPKIYPGVTIPISFIKSVKRLKGLSACKDATTKVLSYDRLLTTALVLAKQFEKLNGQYIGVMLPSSVGVYAIILGLLFAKKTPVMLNWTVGVRSLKYAKDLLNLTSILSSEKFLDKIEYLDLTPIENDVILMEDIRKDIKLKDKLSAALLSKLPANALIKHLKLDQVSVEDYAVVLFTSGTESNPKAVPLSHANIISNLDSSLSQISLLATDFLYGVLPPFHSFGFTVTGLFPLLAGVRVFYAPDPTDAYQICLDVNFYKPTMICLAPSFYKNLFRVARKGQLDSIRLFVSGAEKATQELLKHIEDLGPNHDLLEGYGITECSPVVSINIPNQAGAGVGIPLPILEIKIIHPETHQVIDPSFDGEICIFGPSVFKGYLGEGKKDPFIHIDGKKFYRSGDIGHLDPNTGCLILAGRLKRFVKIGGEMVSLGAIEHELVAHMRGQSHPSPVFVVSALENGEDKTRLALMTNCGLSKEVINDILKHSGFGRIIKIAHVKVVDKIPLMGTGKIDFRKIDEILKNEAEA